MQKYIFRTKSFCVAGKKSVFFKGSSINCLSENLEDFFSRWLCGWREQCEHCDRLTNSQMQRKTQICERVHVDPLFLIDICERRIYRRPLNSLSVLGYTEIPWQARLTVAFRDYIQQAKIIGKFEDRSLCVLFL